MEAKLNKKNQVVVTMSRGEAQRLAEVADCYRVEPRAHDSSVFAAAIQNLGIELWLLK